MSFNCNNEFYCTQCGQKQLFSIPRINGKERPAGHLKKMYCFNCKQEHNFVECKPYTKYTKKDFEIEFNYGNFTPTGERKIKYGLFKNQLTQKGVIVYE